MFDCFLAHLLVVCLILTAAFRMFFVSRSKIDFLVCLAPLAFLIEAANFFIWGADIFIVVMLVFSFINILFNLRSLIRMSAHLLVDEYSVAFVVVNILTILFSFAYIIMLLIYRPVAYNPRNYNVKIENTVISGTLEEGLKVKDNIFTGGSRAGVLKKYSPIEEKESRFEYEPVFIFAGTAMGPVSYYEPYLMMLCQRGYTVYAADLYPEDDTSEPGLSGMRIFKKQAITKKYFEDKEAYDEYRRKEIEILLKEYREITEIVLGLEGMEKKVYYISDGIENDLIYSVVCDFPDNCLGYFPMDSITEYKTSGFGFVDMTHMVTAKKKGLKRDNSFFIPRYLAKKTAVDVEQFLPLKPAAEPENAEEEVAAEEKTAEVENASGTGAASVGDSQ